MTSSTYTVSRGWTGFARGTGYLYLAALACLATIGWLPIGVTTGAVILFGALAVYSHALFRHFQEASLEVSATGVRSLSSSSWVPWESVAELRERPWRQRVDLLDGRGEVLLQIQYQLEGFSEALAEVVERVSVEPSPDPFRGRRPWGLLVLSSALALVGLWLGVIQRDWAGLFITALAALLPLVEWLEGPPTVVSITEDFAVVRRWSGESRYRLGAIRAVAFDNRTLDVVLHLGEDMRLFIRPRGADPFCMFVTILAAVDRAAA